MGKLTLVVILLFGLCAGIASQHVAFDDDEFQHAHMAWLLARGEVPHRDFFEHHLPLYHFLIAPFTLRDPGPERLLALRGFSVLIAMVTLACMARAIKVWSHEEHPGILALMAFSPIFFIKMIEVRPEGFCLLMACATLGCLKNQRKIFLSGLFTGAMVMSSQKFIFLALGLFFLAWKEHGFRSLTRYILGAVIPVLSIGLYYVLTGALPQAFQDLVILNLGWKESFSPNMYASLFWSSSALLIASGLLGAFSAEGTTTYAIRFLLLSAIAAITLVPIPFRQTFLMLYPGLALGATVCWNQFSLPLKTGKRKLAAGFCLSCLGLLPAATALQHEFQSTADADLILMREMDTRGSGPVFDGRGLLFYRDHVGRYAWMHQGLILMLDMEEHAQQTIKELKVSGYPDVLWDYRVEMMSPTFHTFLQENYVSIDPEPLWVPGAVLDRSRLRDGAELSLPVKAEYITSWKGGTVTIDGNEITPGQPMLLGSGNIQVQGTGFIRDFKIFRAGPAE